MILSVTDNIPDNGYYRYLGRHYGTHFPHKRELLCREIKLMATARIEFVSQKERLLM